MKFFTLFQESDPLCHKRNPIQGIVLQEQIFSNPSTFILPCSLFDMSLFLAFRAV